MTELNDRQAAVSSRSWKRVVLRAALFLCLVVAAAGGWLGYYAYRQAPAGEEPDRVVYVPKGSSVRDIAHILGEQGLIDNDVRFLVLARLTGDGSRLKAGEFRLKTGQTPLDVLRDLVHATPIQHKITIPEGLQASEIAELFDREGWCDRRAYENLVTDRRFIDSLGLGALNSLEGYLYPDTYFLTRDMHGADMLIRMQVRRFEEVWQGLLEQAEGPVKMEETVILASLVEKETAAPAERPLIAGVFLNRLKLGMRLQSDPTVVYGVEEYDGTITKSMLTEPTPYNTYVIPGLPAGPIANPGRDALQAVLFPDETPHLYFVSRNDGTHHFSQSLSEHNRAVQKYQRKKNDKNGNDEDH